MVDAVNLHFLVYRPCNDVARRQRQALVVFLHERAAVGQAQHSAVAPHGLGDEEGGMGFARVVERCGMELHKLHVGHRSLGPVYHCLAVAGGNHGVGRGLVDGSAAPGAHQGHLAQVGVNLLCVGV